MKNNLNVMYKGLLIGSTMLVPGVSGGSMAMILGIYDRLISSVSSFTKNIKDNLRFLSLFVLSAGVGMILLAKPILSLLETYPKPMSCFFVGAAAGGIPPGSYTRYAASLHAAAGQKIPLLQLRKKTGQTPP